MTSDQLLTNCSVLAFCTPAPILTDNCGRIIHQSLLGFFCDLIFHPKCKNKGTRFIF